LHEDAEGVLVEVVGDDLVKNVTQGPDESHAVEEVQEGIVCVLEGLIRCGHEPPQVPADAITLHTVLCVSTTSSGKCDLL
jgi:hypothetical protein